MPREPVVAPEKIRFVRQVFLDRPAHAFEQEFGMRGGVEKAVEIRRVVEHADIPALRRLPLDARQEPPRIVLQSRAIRIDPIQDRGGYRKHEPRRVEAPLRQDVMNEIAMDAPVAVIERMDVHKAESQRSSCNDRIEGGRRPPVEGDHAINQRREVFVPRTDVVGERCARVPVVLADKSAFGAQAQTHEPVVADHNVLEPKQFIEVNGLPAGLTHSAAPALNAVVRRALALDRIARLGILQEQECGCAGQQAARNRSDDRPRPLREIEVDEFLECFRAPDERAAIRCARQVVPDTMSRRVLARDRPLLLGVDGRDIVAPCGVRKVQTLPGEPLVKKPEAPSIAAGGRVPDDGFDPGRIHRKEETLQNGKIEPLILDGEGQVRFQCGARSMAGGEQAPASLFQDPVPLARSV